MLCLWGGAGVQDPVSSVSANRHEHLGVGAGRKVVSLGPLLEMLVPHLLSCVLIPLAGNRHLYKEQQLGQRFHDILDNIRVFI